MKETKDILVLFEQLNNHEIFTPPRLAIEILELLPDEVWIDPSLKFLDPCTKSGVFLREIFYKLYEGLKNKGIYKAHDGIEYDLNNNQERINHILKNMIYGIATSELTGYIARRTLYGVMKANTDKQIAALESFSKSKDCKQYNEEEQFKFIGRNKFNDYYNHKIFNTNEYVGFEEEGNIFYPTDEVAKKVLEDGNYEIEDTYYPFINNETKHQKILDIKEGRVKFDVIIGNPPYQISDGGAGASATPIYHLFIEEAISINPKYISMVVPSRWFSGGRGLDSFRNKMLHDKRLKIIHDFLNAKDCFPGVEIKGGVNYFLWERDYSGECEISTHTEENISSVSKRPLLEEGSDVFIRYNEAISIFRKVISHKEKSFSNIVSSRKPFGLTTNFKGESIEFSNSIKTYQTKSIGYVKRKEILQNHNWINKHKILIPKAIGSGDGRTDIIKPIYAEPNTCCTETYLVIGPFENKKESENAISYIKTKFFHFMITLKKNTQDATKKVYDFVPIQDFNESWNDLKLYKKYNLNNEEIAYIEKSIPSME